MATGLAFVSPTIGVGALVPFSYLSTGAAQCVDLGFIPQYITATGGTNTWVWNPNMTQFGTAFLWTVATATIATGCVLDTIDGSGVATTNIATTTKAVGIVLGTNSFVNSGAALRYTGFAIR